MPGDDRQNGMLWAGRFARSPAPEMLRLTRSIDVDVRLLQADIRSTKAHAHALAASGLLAPAALEAIQDACDRLLSDYEGDHCAPQERDEDVHSFVERELTARAGDTGARIHAGRSRNDLVAADLRLWCKDAALSLHARATALLGVLVARAEELEDAVMPGYTHLQRAQSVPLAYHFLAHGFAIARDLARLEGCWKAADRSPLGAGAMAGTTLPLDPSVGAAHLAFGSVFDNGMDAVSDRDFACDLLYAISVAGIHLSRIAEEIVLWTTSEFAFARLPDEWSTGSSMMPHKRNPDLAELVRARAAGGIGDLAGILTLLKGLPFAYNRDLQEDKDFVFRAVDRLMGSLEAAAHLVGSLEIDVARTESAATNPGAWATELAELLVVRGVAFRDAHFAVGGLVAALESRGLGLADATADDLTTAHPLLQLTDVVFANPRRGVEARTGHGATGPGEIARQIDVLRRAKAAATSWRVDKDETAEAPPPPGT
jgi:argininosuccinate lyase